MGNSENDQLISDWVQQDWRRSIFAPGVFILQALTRSGRTASGLGFDRRDALERCVSETAEILSIAELRNANDTKGSSKIAFNPMFGLSAHPNANSARRLAIYEAHERDAVSKWWYGAVAAQRLPADWKIANGVHRVLLRTRTLASVKRETEFWRLDQPDPVHTVICMSRYATGQDPILGFGASVILAEAAKKALRENVLMELNLMEVLAVRGGHSSMDMSRVETKIAEYAVRCPSLLPDIETPPAILRDFDPINLDSANPSLSLRDLHDISPGWLKRTVWQCNLTDRESVHSKGPASPFM